MDPDRTITIAQMATAFGVSHRSLRFYEEKELLRPARKGTARYYGEADKVRLQVILKGKRLGFSLEEIRRLILAHEAIEHDRRATDATALLSRSQIAAQLATLEAERSRLDAAIDELRLAMTRAREPASSLAGPWDPMAPASEHGDEDNAGDHERCTA